MLLRPSLGPCDPVSLYLQLLSTGFALYAPDTKQSHINIRHRDPRTYGPQGLGTKLPTAEGRQSGPRAQASNLHVLGLL